MTLLKLIIKHKYHVLRLEDFLYSSAYSHYVIRLPVGQMKQLEVLAFSDQLTMRLIGCMVSF